MEPNASQILGAKIRAEQERYVKAHRKPWPGGGWEVPCSEVVLEHLAETFNMTLHDVSRHLTFACNCTHKWSDGACAKCPDPDRKRGHK